jgi:hypothetical protein
MSESPRDLVSTDIRVEAFETDHLPLVAAFCETYWKRPRNESYYSWRYLDSRPFSRMFLARTADQCLGMLYAFRKPYLIDGERTECSEIFDWHSLPGLSGSGIGIRLMRAMMRQNRRLLGVGGTSDAQKALPAMGWQLIGEAVDYELPTTGEALLPGLRRRVSVQLPGERLALDATVASWFKPKRRKQVGDAVTVSYGDTAAGELAGLYAGDTGYDFVQSPEPQWLQWLTASGAPVGQFRHWRFMVGGVLRGWALTRIYDTHAGKEGAIAELFAPRPDASLYTWMISEAALGLYREGVRLIRTLASCPVFKAALAANRFRPADTVPVYTYPKLPVPPERLHITLNHTDACLRPYPRGPVEIASAESSSALHSVLEMR